MRVRVSGLKYEVFEQEQTELTESGRLELEKWGLGKIARTREEWNIEKNATIHSNIPVFHHSNSAIPYSTIPSFRPSRLCSLCCLLFKPDEEQGLAD